MVHAQCPASLVHTASLSMEVMLMISPVAPRAMQHDWIDLLQPRVLESSVPVTVTLSVRPLTLRSAGGRTSDRGRTPLVLDNGVASPVGVSGAGVTAP